MSYITQIKKTALILIVVFLCIPFAQGQTKQISRHWTSFVQSIDIKANKSTKFKVQGWVKVVGHQKDSLIKGALWARVDTNTNERGFFDNMVDRPIISNEWRLYEINGEFDATAQKLNFGGLCYRDGSFYFDDIKVFITNEQGDYIPVEIDNHSFEHKEASNSWSLGVSTNGNPIIVKEFTYSNSTDSKEGTQSLLIKGENTPNPSAPIIRVEEGFSPQIGVLISMLNSLKSRVESQVRALDQRETDHLMDEQANRIGALIMHLAATEAYYQVRTFERRAFNDEEKEKWLTALKLGEKAREQYKGKPIEFYLHIFDEVRQKTMAEFKKREDTWLEETMPGTNMNHYYRWFHVMEHQSSHLGQILLMKKRIPKEDKASPILEKKVD